MEKNNIENNRINVITLSDYSEYIESKHRNDDPYGYDYIYTYNRDTDSFTYEWTTTSELISDDGPSGNYSLTQVLAYMANFIRRNANISGCTVYVNGTVIWESTPVYSQDINESGLYFDE